MGCKKCGSPSVGFKRCEFKDGTRHIFTKCNDCRYVFYTKVSGITLSLTEGQSWKSLKERKKENRTEEDTIKVKKLKSPKERVKCICGGLLAPKYQVSHDEVNLKYKSTHWACNRCNNTRASYFEQASLF